jgi:hypothetical protein
VLSLAKMSHQMIDGAQFEAADTKRCQYLTDIWFFYTNTITPTIHFTVHHRAYLVCRSAMYLARQRKTYPSFRLDARTQAVATFNFICGLPWVE